jgi:Raf kinase inhibitor-like YbhB/YbcL family protein
MNVHSVRHSGSALVLGLVLSMGALGACSSSNSSPKDGGGTGGTGAGGAPANDAASNPDASPATITLTSTAFTDGQAFPAVNTCAGANTSPALSWTAGPTGTQSYAVVLTDLANGFVHWVIWDIPAATRMLPPALPNDNMLTAPVTALQVHFSFGGAGGGYFGPCPSGAVHNYQFQVHAIPTATLAGAATTWTSDQVKAAVLSAAIAHGDLNGTSNASPPGDGGGSQ